MAVTINGTTGIAGVDGSASTPAVQGTDTNTGIFFPAADTIAFGEGGAESARLNADAQFVSAAGTASLPVLTTTGDLNTGVFYPAADTVAWTTGGTERMRITSGGDLLVGTTTHYSTGKVVSYTTSTDPTASPPVGFSYVAAGGYGGGYFLSDTGSGGGSQKGAIWLESGRLYVGTATTGAMTKGVYLANTGTSWTSASDERVKDIIEPINNAIQKLSDWRTVIGKYKTDEDGVRRSFLIAQDVLATFPEAVDAKVEEELGLKYQDTIPLLVAAIQELNAKVETLEAQNAAFEARLAALEAK